MPGFPLPLRNALAALAIAALDDDAAADALRWLRDAAGSPPPEAAPLLVARHLIDPGGQSLLPVHAPHGAAVAQYAARALAARSAHASTVGSAPPVTRAVHQAVALWNASLFFEVHEVLEAVWRTASGETRQALQGVIQIAVAHHHLGHGNVRGARSLMSEGRGRLGSVPADTLAPLDAAALLDATAAWESIRSGDAVPAGDPPLLRLRVLG